MNDTIDSRSAPRLPSRRRFGFCCQAAIARWMKPRSMPAMVSVPTARLSWNASPARIDSMIAGVPASSRCSSESQ